MADLFTSLARRTLEATPSLAPRVPSRFEPSRAGFLTASPGSARELQSPMNDPGPPPAAAPGPAATRPEGSETAAPPMRAHTLGQSRVGEPRSPTAPRSPALSPRPGSGSATGARGDEPPRQESSATASSPSSRRAAAPESRERSLLPQRAADPARRPTRDRPAAALPESRHRHPQPAAHAGPTDPPRSKPPAGESAEPTGSPEAVRGDKTTSPEGRFLPLLPPQPTPTESTLPTRETGGRENSGGSPDAPTIEVTIGCIEVRAAAPAATDVRPEPGPALSLDDYLERRETGGR